MFSRFPQRFPRPPPRPPTPMKWPKIVPVRCLFVRWDTSPRRSTCTAIPHREESKMTASPILLNRKIGHCLDLTAAHCDGFKPLLNHLHYPRPWLSNISWTMCDRLSISPMVTRQRAWIWMSMPLLFVSVVRRSTVLMRSISKPELLHRRSLAVRRNRTSYRSASKVWTRERRLRTSLAFESWPNRLHKRILSITLGLNPPNRWQRQKSVDRLKLFRLRYPTIVFIMIIWYLLCWCVRIAARISFSMLDSMDERCSLNPKREGLLAETFLFQKANGCCWMTVLYSCMDGSSHHLSLSLCSLLVRSFRGHVLLIFLSLFDLFLVYLNEFWQTFKKDFWIADMVTYLSPTRTLRRTISSNRAIRLMVTRIERIFSGWLRFLPH